MCNCIINKKKNKTENITLPTLKFNKNMIYLSICYYIQHASWARRVQNERPTLKNGWIV